MHFDMEVYIEPQGTLELGSHCFYDTSLMPRHKQKHGIHVEEDQPRSFFTFPVFYYI